MNPVEVETNVLDPDTHKVPSDFFDGQEPQPAEATPFVNKPLPSDMTPPNPKKLVARELQLLRAKQKRRAERKRGNVSRQRNRRSER